MHNRNHSHKETDACDHTVNHTTRTRIDDDNDKRDDNDDDDDDDEEEDEVEDEEAEDEEAAELEAEPLGRLQESAGIRSLRRAPSAHAACCSLHSKLRSSRCCGGYQQNTKSN